MYGEVVSKSTWPPILSEAAWRAVGDAMARNATTPRPRVAWLLGVARCGPCGASLVTSRRSSGRKARTYKCPNGCVEVAADLLESHVEQTAWHGAEPWPADVATRLELAKGSIERVDVDQASTGDGGNFNTERIRIALK